VPSCQSVRRRNVADGAVQADVVVVLDILTCDPARILQRKRRLRTDALPLDGLVEALPFPIRLQVVRRGLFVIVVFGSLVHVSGKDKGILMLAR